MQQCRIFFRTFDTPIVFAETPEFSRNTLSDCFFVDELSGRDNIDVTAERRKIEELTEI